MTRWLHYLQKSSVHISQLQQVPADGDIAPSRSWVQDHRGPPAATGPLLAVVPRSKSIRSVSVLFAKRRANLREGPGGNNSVQQRCIIHAICIVLSLPNCEKAAGGDLSLGWGICLSSFAWCEYLNVGWLLVNCERNKLLCKFFFFEVFKGYLRFNTSLRIWNNQDVPRLRLLTDQFFSTRLKSSGQTECDYALYANCFFFFHVFFSSPQAVEKAGRMREQVHWVLFV